MTVTFGRGEASLPKRVFLASAPNVTVAWAGPGLVVYLDDARYWAGGGAAVWFERFLALIDTARLSFYTTSVLDRWVPLSNGDLPQLFRGLEVGRGLGTIRHLFELRVVDDPGAAGAGFAYREVDNARSPRSGVAQFWFPDDVSLESFLSFAIELATEAPFHCGVGGWLARYNPRALGGAFREIRAWTKRYVGLDVQWPDETAYRAHEGLPSVSWLNLLGPTLASRIAERVPRCDASAEKTRTIPARNASRVTCMPLARGCLVRAGDAPSLGDVNFMHHAPALRDAARVLAPVLLPTPPSFPGPHWTPETTRQWQQRFVSTDYLYAS